MKEELSYFNYTLPNELIEHLIARKNIHKVVFHIDMNSICKGMFSRTVLEHEFEVLRNKRSPKMLFKSLQYLLKNLFDIYSKYDPQFFVFYDLGGSVQNKTVSSAYKSNRTLSSKKFLKDEEEAKLYYQLRSYYFEKIPEYFNIDNVSKTICLNEYESDFVPYELIRKNEFMQSPNVLNLVLSIDKDLLQCCQLPNTYQAINQYRRAEKQYHQTLFSDKNALSYIYKNFSHKQYPSVTSKYVPLVLAIAKDTADGIVGIKNGFGVASAIKLIDKYHIPHDFDVHYPLPVEIGGCQDQLQINLDLTSFERQIQRVPKHILDLI